MAKKSRIRMGEEMTTSKKKMKDSMKIWRKLRTRTLQNRKLSFFSFTFQYYREEWQDEPETSNAEPSTTDFQKEFKVLGKQDFHTLSKIK